MPAYPKHPSVVQHRHKASTATTLVPTQGQVEVPELPPRYVMVKTKNKSGEVIGKRKKAKWHPAAVDSWREIWESPMIEEFLEADFGAIRQLIAMESDFWERMENGQNVAMISAEIIRLRKLCGLVPMGRRSLQWTIAQTNNTASRAKPISVDAEVIEDAQLVELPTADIDRLYDE